MEKLEQFMDYTSDTKKNFLEIIKNLLIFHKSEERILKNFMKKHSPM